MSSCLNISTTRIGQMQISASLVCSIGSVEKIRYTTSDGDFYLVSDGGYYLLLSEE